MLGLTQRRRPELQSGFERGSGHRALLSETHQIGASACNCNAIPARTSKQITARKTRTWVRDRDHGFTDTSGADPAGIESFLPAPVSFALRRWREPRAWTVSRRSR